MYQCTYTLRSLYNIIQHVNPSHSFNFANLFFNPWIPKVRI